MSDVAASLARLDTAAKRQEYIFGVPNLVQDTVTSALSDHRDAPALYLLLNVCCLVAPAAVLLFLLPRPPHWLGAAYFLATYGCFLQRFMLTLHFTQHRQLFKPGGAAAGGNLVAPYLLAPLFGLPPGAYHLHHCAMHHAQGNAAPGDASSTEPYQRDNALAFLRYWLRFAVLGGPQLVAYAVSTRRWGPAARCAVCLVMYWWAVGAGLAARPVAATWVLLVPYLVSSLALMFGNWSQHVFINPASHRDPYGLAYTCVACPDNARTYNDGYHATHHANSRTHWSELPQRWLESLPEQDARDALVFRGIGFFEVGAAVMAGRLSWLADHIVPCGPRQASRSRQEWVEELRRRLLPVDTGSTQAAAELGAWSTAAAPGSQATSQATKGGAAEGKGAGKRGGKGAAAAS